MTCSATSFYGAARRCPLIRSPRPSTSFQLSRWLKREKLCAPVRNVIVTGGSRGLGLAIVRQLMCAGYRAIAVARKESEELAAVREEAERVNRGALAFAAFDLADIDGIGGVGRSFPEEVGPLPRLV